MKVSRFITIVIILQSCLFNPQQSYNVEVKQIVSDIFDTAILLENGTVLTWGRNPTGLLANGTTKSSKIPKQSEYLSNITSINFTEGAAIASDSDGNIWFWGNRLIWAEEPYDSTIVVPQKISFLEGVIDIVVHSIYVLLLDDEGNVWKLIWDHNKPTNYIQPVQIVELTNIIQISGILALDNNGLLHEYPEFSYLGQDEGSIDDTLITNIEYIQNRILTHTIILKKDSTVWAWGKNPSGVLGNGTYENCNIPRRIENLKDIIAISANSTRCLALDKYGHVWYWGLLDLDLDNDIHECEPIPTLISDIENVRMIYASPVHESILLKEDGSLWTFDFKKQKIEEIKY